MRARVAFYAVAVAFLFWLAYAILAAPSGGEPTPTDGTSGPEPTAPPVTVTTADPRVPKLERRLQAARRAAATSRRRARYVIHHAVSSGSHWLERAFACVHAGEGAWNSATGNGYYGGLQMDISFQRTYAPWALRAFGTADRWPVSVQISTAIQAELTRGFAPWPNTARACGLLR